MIRTQIQLTEEQSKQLKALSKTEDVSVAELIRRSVDAYLDAHHKPSRKALRERAMNIVGKYASDEGDLGIRHDDYLEEAYGDFGS